MLLSNTIKGKLVGSPLFTSIRGFTLKLIATLCLKLVGYDYFEKCSLTIIRSVNLCRNHI